MFGKRRIKELEAENLKLKSKVESCLKEVRRWFDEYQRSLTHLIIYQNTISEQEERYESLGKDNVDVKTKNILLERKCALLEEKVAELQVKLSKSQKSKIANIDLSQVDSIVISRVK